MYMVAMVCSLFGIRLPFLYQPTLLGIGMCAAIVVVAALNLILDFNSIQQAAQQGAPKYYEWYSAFGLMVTIVWLYIEVLRLLSLIAMYSRDE